MRSAEEWADACEDAETREDLVEVIRLAQAEVVAEALACGCGAGMALEEGAAP